MFDAETVRLVESGASLVIGFVDAEGAPVASRGFGLTVLDASTPCARLLLDAEDEPALAQLAPGAAIAVTAGNVRTLRAKQFKGHVVKIEPTTPSDAERAEQYFSAFALAVHEADGTDREPLERLVPTRYVACIVAFDETFDQTPGPGAGAPIERTA